MDCAIHFSNVSIFYFLKFLQHGKVKTKRSAEDQESKRKEREKKTKLYQLGIERAFTKVLHNGSNYE
jgi:hypothetical protein